MTYCYENTRTGELAAGEKLHPDALQTGWTRINKRLLLRLAKERGAAILPIMKEVKAQ